MPRVSRERWRLPFAGLLLAIILLTGACGPTDDGAPDVRLDWEVRPDPPKIGSALFSVALADSAGASVSGAIVELEANMSHPGMTPVAGVAEEVRPGYYTTPLDFTMAGDWYVIAEAELPDGRVVRRQIDLRIVQ